MTNRLGQTATVIVGKICAYLNTEDLVRLDSTSRTRPVDWPAYIREHLPGDVIIKWRASVDKECLRYKMPNPDRKLLSLGWTEDDVPAQVPYHPLPAYAVILTRDVRAIDMALRQTVDSHPYYWRTCWWARDNTTWLPGVRMVARALNRAECNCIVVDIFKQTLLDHAFAVIETLVPYIRQWLRTRPTVSADHFVREDERSYFMDCTPEGPISGDLVDLLVGLRIDYYMFSRNVWVMVRYMTRERQYELLELFVKRNYGEFRVRDIVETTPVDMFVRILSQVRFTSSETIDEAIDFAEVVGRHDIVPHIRALWRRG